MGKLLKKLREALHLSQQTLGDRIGLSYSSIAKYECEVPDEIVRKLMVLADKGGFPGIAKELSDERWPVKQVGETGISQVPKKLCPEERGFEAELHSILDEILQGPTEAVEATETALRLFVKSARRRSDLTDGSRRRRG